MLHRHPPRHFTDPLLNPMVVEEMHSSVILQTSPQSWISEKLRKTPFQKYRHVYKITATLKASRMNVLKITVIQGLSSGLHSQPV